VEGMPISLLEAMSYGIHCLISNIPENIEVAEKYAETFQKGNVEDLHNKLKEMLDNLTLDNRKDEKIQEYVVKKYNWDNIVEQTIQLYKK
jgi:glycosyltransferase involved in cell wall biosynthesis